MDQSVEDDAARLRWLLDGHGFFLEEEGLCGYSPCSEQEKETARIAIDKARGKNGTTSSPEG